MRRITHPACKLCYPFSLRRERPHIFVSFTLHRKAPYSVWLVLLPVRGRRQRAVLLSPPPARKTPHIFHLPCTGKASHSVLLFLPPARGRLRRAVLLSSPPARKTPHIFHLPLHRKAPHSVLLFLPPARGKARMGVFKTPFHPIAPHQIFKFLFPGKYQCRTPRQTLSLNPFSPSPCKGDVGFRQGWRKVEQRRSSCRRLHGCSR